MKSCLEFLRTPRCAVILRILQIFAVLWEINSNYSDETISATVHRLRWQRNIRTVKRDSVFNFGIFAALGFQSYKSDVLCKLGSFYPRNLVPCGSLGLSYVLVGHSIIRPRINLPHLEQPRTCFTAFNVFFRTNSGSATATYRPGVLIFFTKIRYFLPLFTLKGTGGQLLPLSPVFRLLSVDL